MSALIATLLLLSSASAQEPPLERARHHLERSEYEELDLALDEAARGEMDRDALQTWLELRVLAAYSAEHFGAMEEALAGLACILPPDAPAPDDFPRAARERLAELRAAETRLELAPEVTARLVDGARHLGVVVEVARDPGHLVRAIQVVAVFDDGAELSGEAAVHHVLSGDVSRDIPVRYGARAIGPGGAVIATLGAPWVEDVIAGLPPDETGLHVGIVVASSVIIVAGIAVAFAAVATDGFRLGGQTVLEGPVLAPLLRF